MELIVDLHVHSHYSRATSKDCTLEGIYKWGKLKGIHVIGTGDFTHPTWFAEMQDKLEPAEPGLFRLKSIYADPIDALLPATIRPNLIRFVPTVEIATIYSKGGKVRKLHQLLIAPSFETVRMINNQLGRIGNLAADGRPILGLDSKELLRTLLEVNPEGFFIPAHIWTPWFGLFGSKSGFNSIEEAYEDLSPHIHAIETGLSSDPGMNWRVPNLDGIALTSNSDAHSPQKLGREATVVTSNLTYADIIGGLRTNDKRLTGTIEFFPQEGKYFSDGHRTCNVRLNPDETRKLGGICPECGKPVVVGVNYRVGELANRPSNYLPSKPKRVEYIIPLSEIVAEIRGLKSASARSVTAECARAYEILGSEFAILRQLPIEQIKDAGFDMLAVAVQRLRTGKVLLDPGYDGIYGTVRVFKDNDERKNVAKQFFS